MRETEERLRLLLMAQTAQRNMEALFRSPQPLRRHEYVQYVRREIRRPLTPEEELQFAAVELGRIHADALHLIADPPLWYARGRSLRINVEREYASRIPSEAETPSLLFEQRTKAVQWNEAVDASLIVSVRGGGLASGSVTDRRVSEAMANARFKRDFDLGVRLRQREQRGEEIAQAIFTGIDIAMILLPLIVGSPISLRAGAGRRAARISSLRAWFLEIIRRLPVLWASLRSGTARARLVFPLLIRPETTAAELKALLRQIWDEFRPIQSMNRIARNPTRAGIENVLREFYDDTKIPWMQMEPGEVHRLTRPGEPLPSDPLSLNVNDPNVNFSAIERVRMVRGGENPIFEIDPAAPETLLIDKRLLDEPRAFFRDVKHTISSDHVFGVRRSRSFPQIPGVGFTPPKLLEMMVEDGLRVLGLISEP